MINIIERQFDKLSKKIKKYKCNLCGRPIKHKGNCLKCNLIAKEEKEKKVAERLPVFIDVILSQILKIKSVDHKEIQLQLWSIFRSLGYFVELEKKIQAKRPGRIDLFAKKNNFSIGIEIDHSIIRWKSINKLNTLRPNLAIYILKSRNINPERIESRVNLIKTKAVLVYLFNKETRKLKWE